MNFDQLITQLHRIGSQLTELAGQTASSWLVCRNWLIGAYLIKFEQHGEKRAYYGAKLISTVAQKLHLRGLNIRNLEASRLLYLAYPFLIPQTSSELGKSHTFIRDSRDYLADIVFYHRKLHCHVSVELKAEPFNHANIGLLNTYLNYFKKHEMQEGDNPPIGILPCTDKDHALVEYALGGMGENLFVSSYKVALPSEEELTSFLIQHV